MRAKDWRAHSCTAAASPVLGRAKAGESLSEEGSVGLKASVVSAGGSTSTEELACPAAAGGGGAGSSRAWVAVGA